MNVVQTGSDPAVGRRARTRQRRLQRYLETALDVVVANGLDALTMQRLADELDLAVGTVYSYFPSKSALVAEVQRGAIEVLGASYRTAADGWEDWLAAEDDPRQRSLVRLVLQPAFWIAAAERFPAEFGLQVTLLHDHGGVVAPEDAERVLPAAMELLDEARSAHDLAVLDGVLRSGDALGRILTLGAVVNGSLQIGSLDPVARLGHPGPQLARTGASDLIAGWGADPAGIAEAWQAIDRRSRRHPLAPDPEGGSAR